MSDQEEMQVEVMSPGALRDDMVRNRSELQAILEPADVVIRKGKDGKKTAIYKKSFFRKVAARRSDPLSVTIQSESHEEIAGDIVYYATYRSIDKLSTEVTGDGTCSMNEIREANEETGRKLKPTHHITRGIANTRAFNRAVSNHRCGGMVSAEEMSVRDAVATEEQGANGHPTPGVSKGVPTANPDGRGINPAQVARLWKIFSVSHGKEADHHQLFQLVESVCPGIPHTKSAKGNDMPDLSKIGREQYDVICNTLIPDSNKPREI